MSIDGITIAMELEDRQELMRPGGAFGLGYVRISKAGQSLVSDKLMIFVAATLLIDGLRKVLSSRKPCTHRFESPNTSFSLVITRREDGQIAFSGKEGTGIDAEQSMIVGETLKAAAALIQQAEGTPCQDDAPVRDLGDAIRDLAM
jgi:hypothetical protein